LNMTDMCKWVILLSELDEYTAEGRIQPRPGTGENELEPPTFR
jgi:hypothetical protein